MTIRNLLSPPVPGILAVLGALFALDLFIAGIVSEHNDATLRMDAELGALSAVAALPPLVLNMQSGMRGYLLTGNKNELHQYRAASERFPRMIGDALALTVADDVRTELAAASTLAGRWVETRLSPLVVKRNAGEGSSRSMAQILRTVRAAHGDPFAQRVLAKLDAAARLQETRVAAATTALQSHSGRISYWMRIRAIALLLSVAALALLLGRAVARLTRQTTSRETAEKTARESSAALQAMNDASPLGMFLTDGAGSCRHANGAMVRITGLSESAIAGTGWMAALHPDDRDHVQSGWARAMADASPFVSEHRFLHRDGNVVWAVMKTAAVRDGGDPIGHVCSVENVTDRRNVEDALRRSEERLHLALEGSHLALFDWHLPSGEIVLSAQWQAFSGNRAGPPETTARRLADELHPQDREPLRQSVIAALKGQTPGLLAEFRIRQASGNWKRLRVQARVTARDAVGRAVQLTGTLAGAG
jgi:PAS domain S-box-containing protein